MRVSDRIASLVKGLPSQFFKSARARIAGGCPGIGTLADRSVRGRRGGLMARLGIVAALACSLLCTVASAQDKPDSSTAKSELHPDIARLVDTWLDAEQ